MTPLKELAQFAWHLVPSQIDTIASSPFTEIAALLETLAAADAKMPCIRLALNPLTDASEAYVKQSDALAAVAAAQLQPATVSREHQIALREGALYLAEACYFKARPQEYGRIPGNPPQAAMGFGFLWLRPPSLL